MGKTTIEWATHSWQVSVGCSEPRGAQACARCYARGIAARFGEVKGHRYEGVAKFVNGYSRWTGKVEPLRETLDEPFHWKKPRRVFVDSMADLFHEFLPFEYIQEVFEVMALNPIHTFMVLTKRPERMAQFADFWREAFPEPARWPANVWAGTSIGTQKFVEPRMKALLQVPAKVRFLSLEPLLEQLDLSEFYPKLCTTHLMRLCCGRTPSIHLMIIGGESGRGASSLELDWVRSLIKQARVMGASPFVKQLGSAWAKTNESVASKGGDMDAWPEDIRVREIPR